MTDLALGPFMLPLPTLLVLLALGAALVLGARLAKRRQLDAEGPLWLLAAWILLMARAGFVLRYHTLYFAEPLRILDLRDGGFMPAAGLAAAGAAAAWIAWQRSARRIPLLGALAAGVLVWSAGNAALKQWPPQQRLPAAEFATLDGQAMRLSSGSGRPVVVNLWASWCPPCRREMPLLASAQRRHPDTVFLFPNQGEPAQLVKHYLQTLMPEIRNVLLDPAGQFSIHVGSQALPLTLFFSDRGILLRKHVGELSEAELEQAIAELKTAPGSR